MVEYSRSTWQYQSFQSGLERAADLTAQSGRVWRRGDDETER
jgi:Flp pilus assembly protein TadG